MTVSEQPYSSMSLIELKEKCEAELSRYRRSKGKDKQSQHCLEIVHRAAQHDKEAIGVLLLTSTPFIKSKCPPQLKDQASDFVQEVWIKLNSKFSNVQNPFQVSTFGEYMAFVKATTKSVIINLGKRQQRDLAMQSSDALLGTGFEPAQSDKTAQVENRFILECCLERLERGLEYEIFYRRYVLGEKPKDIAETLRPVAPDIDVKEVYAYAASAVRRLRSDDTLRRLWAE